MADYTQTTLFGPKDGLTTGDPLKLIRGTEVDTELGAIATAIATKYDDTDVADQATAEALTSNTTLITPLRLGNVVTQLAGNGLALTGGVMRVGLGTGITSDADTVSLDIDGLTDLAAAAATGDFVALYDISGSVLRKVSVTNLVAGTGFVPNSRDIIAGNGLTGGGDLSADRTLNVVGGTGITVAADEVSATQATEGARGALEIATQAETDAGSDDTRAVTPAKLAAFSGLGAESTLVSKSSDETVANSNTFQNDDDLVITNVSTGFYRIDMLLQVREVNPAAAGNFKFDFSTVGVGSTGQILHARLDTFAGAAGPAFDEIGLLTDDFDNMSLATGSATSRLMVTGYYDVVSATNTLQLRWAQHTATALGSIDVEAGSFLAVTRLGDT